MANIPHGGELIDLISRDRYSFWRLLPKNTLSRRDNGRDSENFIMLPTL
jgi:hypothetical protein